MNLLFDANISWRIIKILNNYFPNINHVQNLDIKQPATDVNIWLWCQENNYNIITHDDDFEQIVLIKGFPPKVIILKTFNKNTSELSNLIINKKQEIEDFLLDANQSILEIF